MLKLVKHPDPILKQQADPYEFGLEWPSADELEDQMLDVMMAEKGIGLAANQVGLLKRVFAIKLSTGRSLCMFNPKVISTSEKTQDGDEGCLSFPDLWLQISRPLEVVAEYFDKNAQQCKIILTNIDARCFLHELDHLNGVCFTDNVGQLKLALAMKQQQQRKSNGRTKR
jgi:peptide deformylase